ncbi:MAG: TerB family tellurite resistance protein [Chitinophagaceae bacterium]
MEQTEKLLKDYPGIEKGAYLGAIASIATADHEASSEELGHLTELCDAAELNEEQRGLVMHAATTMSEEDLRKCLDVLKGSDLRFSLVTDMIAFAESDQNYTPEEKANVEKIAQYLNINQQQFALLDQFVKKTKSADVAPEQVTQPGFLDQLGLGDKMRSAGINTGSLLRTVIGVAGPLILANMMGRRSGRSGGLGGMAGGLGGMLGGAMMGGRGGGGLGSVIGMLNGGRGLGSTGGLLGRILGGGRF